MDRLVNWKFISAVRRLDHNQATGDEREVVNALARLFGNVGHALDGDLGMLVGLVVDDLCAGSGARRAFLLGPQTGVPPASGSPSPDVP